MERAEGLRSVPVRIRVGHLARDAVINGYPDGTELRRVLDSHGAPAWLPADGVLLTKKLADLLGVHAGDSVTIEKREGNREHYRLHVSGLVDEMFGLQGHMRMSSLSQLFNEAPAVSSVALLVDPAHLDDVEQRLEQMPRVASVSRKDAAVDSIQKQMDETVVFMTVILTLFAATIAIGVVYNNARVAVSVRSRDLASLRVLGFTRAEISAVLLGEIAVQVVLAIPIGLRCGDLDVARHRQHRRSGAFSSTGRDLAEDLRDRDLDHLCRGPRQRPPGPAASRPTGSDRRPEDP